jgi:cobalamin biosynthesis protein CobT
MVPQMTPVLEKCRTELGNMEWDGTVGQLVDQAERILALCMEPGDEGEGEGEGDEGDGEGEGDEGDSEDTEGDDSSQSDTEGGEDFTDGDGSSQKPTEGEDSEEEPEGDPDSTEGEGEEGDEEDDTEGDGDGDEPEDGEDTEGEGKEPEPEPEADFDWDIGDNMMQRWSDDVMSSGGNNWVIGDHSADEILEEGQVFPEPYTHIAHHELREFEKLGAALAIRVKRALETNTLRFRGNRDRGQVDPRNVYKVAAGLPNGFRKRLPTEANDTAIMLGIDASASMHNDNRFPLTRKLMFIWNAATGKLKIPLGVYQWSTGFSGVPRVSGYDPKTNRWTNFVSRHYGLDIRMLKEFDTPGNHPDTLGRLNSYRTHNSTPTAEGLAFGCDRLAKRHERKKILFFLTDGMPDACQRQGGQPGIEVHVEQIQKTLQEAKRQGILVVVLGIDCDDTYGYFKDQWLRASSARDFVNITSQKLVKIISHWRV